MACSWLLRQVASSSPYLKTMASSIIRIREPPPSLFLPRFFLSSSSSSDDSSSVKSTPPPWLMLTPEIKLTSGTDTVFKFYSLAEDKVISVDRRNLKVQLGLESEEEIYLECRGSSHGWLVLLDRCSYDLFLYNPLSNRHLKLPSIRKLKAFRRDFLEGLHLRMKKVIISSSDPEGDANCRALMIHGDDDELAFCCPKSSDEWTETSHQYKDVVCSGDSMLFLGIRPNCPKLEGWDLKDVSRPMLIYLKKPSPCRDANFIVPAAAADNMYYVVCLCGGDLSYVNAEGDYHFQVRKFDFESARNEYDSLDGLAFFVGRNHSFALPAAEFEFLEPNTIYFTHPSTGVTRHHRESLGRKYVKAYNYEYGTFSPAPLYTFTTGDCWNPPMWYTPTCAAALV